MKNIEIDEELYQYIVSQTQSIGESASSILRRLLSLDDSNNDKVVKDPSNNTESSVGHSKLESITKPTVEPTVEATAIQVNTPPVDSGETVFNFINKEELAMQRGAVGRFLLILAALYRVHRSQFSAVTEISGRDRLYFAKSEAELSESGSSTKPRQIPNSPFWVITNSNTTRKKMMLTKAAVAMGYNLADVEKIRELL